MKRNFKRSQYINTIIVFSLNIKTLNFLEKSILLGYLIRNFQRIISHHKKKPPYINHFIFSHAQYCQQVHIYKAE